MSGIQFAQYKIENMKINIDMTEEKVVDQDIEQQKDFNEADDQTV